jgi:hypothetical protein
MVFHNQHSYNPSYVVDNENWNMTDSGLKGSSFIQIPYLLKYFTGGIEYHHIHHFNSKIPNYNLQSYHEEVISKSNIFDNIVKLSITDCYNNLTLSLLPVAFNCNYLHTNLFSTRFIDLWDYETFGSNEYINYVSFIASNFISLPTPYPANVTLTQNQITVKLDLLWQ